MDFKFPPIEHRRVEPVGDNGRGRLWVETKGGWKRQLEEFFLEKGKKNKEKLLTAQMGIWMTACF